MFDVVGRDPQNWLNCGARWRRVKVSICRTANSSAACRLNMASVPAAARIADRIAHIRKIHQDYGVVIDPHTADGMKVALENRDVAVPTLVLETALPAKFEETMVEALGQKLVRPAGLENLEQLPQRVEVMPADLAQIQAFIARHVE